MPRIDVPDGLDAHEQWCYGYVMRGFDAILGNDPTQYAAHRAQFVRVLRLVTEKLDNASPDDIRTATPTPS